MADPRFHKKAGPLTVARLCDISGAELATPDLADREITDVAALSEAGPDHVTFLEGRKLLPVLKTSQAGAVLVTEKMKDALPAGVAGLVVAEPQRSFADIIDAFYPRQITPGIAPSAVIDPTTTIGEGVEIGPNVVIAANAEIGAGTIIKAGASIGPGVVIGARSYVGPNATIICALIGNDVIIHGNVGIGHDGYGFAMGAAGHRKLQQLGRVLIEDNVEIGAGTTIDRGALGDTVIGAGSKIDNLVMIAHNCRIGKNCIITGQCGLAGSTVLEDFVIMGAQTGTAGHLTVGMGAMLAARSGVKDDLPAGGVYGGAPAKPVKEWMREVAAVALLAKQNTKKKS